MNEVEKMYKTIFGEFASNCSLCTKLIDCEIFNNTHNCNKFECDYKRLFTAEKQLELIKWLMCKKQTIQVELRLYENDYCISHITECEHNDAVEYVETGRKNTFDEALADLVNELWQDLTEEERKQIKNILESEVRE